jgi:hypothetical protein
MEATQKWIDATVDVVRAAFAPGATIEQRQHAAAACATLQAMLVPGFVPGWPAPPQPPEPQRDVFDLLLERLAPLIPVRPDGFVTPSVPK